MTQEQHLGPRSMLFSAVINRAVSGADTAEDSIRTTCQKCGTRQALSEALPNEQPHFTDYTCRVCSGSVLHPLFDGLEPKPGPPPGSVLGEARVRNPEEVQVTIPSLEETFAIPKMTIRHDPTPAERDELVKAPEGLGFEEAVKRVLDSQADGQ